MARLSVYYKPIITHLVDSDSGRTLCGVTLREDWVWGGEADTGETGALCGCVRCRRIAEKLDRVTARGGEGE